MRQANFEEKMKAVEQDAYDARMAAMTLPARGTCIVDDKTAIMDREYFNELLDYSLTMPTGCFIGKRWRRDANIRVRYGAQARIDGPRWLMGEYVKTDDPNMAATKWREIVVL